MAEDRRRASIARLTTRIKQRSRRPGKASALATLKDMARIRQLTLPVTLVTPVKKRRHTSTQKKLPHVYTNVALIIKRHRKQTTVCVAPIELLVLIVYQ